jgi:hypothetical protein
MLASASFQGQCWRLFYSSNRYEVHFFADDVGHGDHLVRRAVADHRGAADAVAASKVQFVLGDLLPGDLVDEYRVQLQKFLQDPSDATIDAVTQALEAKAKTFD